MLSLFLIALLIMGSALANPDQTKNPMLKEKIEQCQKLVKKSERSDAPDFMQKRASMVTLDSILQSNGGKQLMQYNSDGLLTNLKLYIADSLGVASLNEEDQFSYDPSGNQILHLKIVAGSDGVMSPEEKVESVYDADGRLISEITWENSDGELVPSEKSVITFVNDTTVREDNYSYQSLTSTWELTDYMISTLNGEKLTSHIEEYEKNEETGVLELTYKIHYYNYENGMATLGIYESFDTETKEWSELMRMEIKFDKNGNLILERQLMNFMGVYLTLAEITLDYNSDNEMVKMEIKSIDLMSGSLFLSYRYEYVYSGGKLTQEICSTPIDNETDSLIVTSKTEITYENDPGSMDIAVPSWYFDDVDESMLTFSDLYRYGRIKQVKYFQTDMATKELNLSYKSDYYYSNSLTPAGIVNVKGIKIGPNPFSQELMVQLPLTGKYTVMLYNSIGSVVYKNSINGNAIIAPAALKSGIYTLQINQENRTIFRSKCVKH